MDSAVTNIDDLATYQMMLHNVNSAVNNNGAIPDTDEINTNNSQLCSVADMVDKATPLGNSRKDLFPASRSTPMVNQGSLTNILNPDSDKLDLNTNERFDDDDEQIEVVIDFTKRPPYSYANLIQMAINTSDDKKMTLREIFEWIENKFPFYKYTTCRDWKNSVRHYLSLYDFFVRVKRQNNRSGFWTFKPEIDRNDINNLTDGNDTTFKKSKPTRPKSIKNRSMSQSTSTKKRYGKKHASATKPAPSPKPAEPIASTLTSQSSQANISTVTPQPIQVNLTMLNPQLVQSNIVTMLVQTNVSPLNSQPIATNISTLPLQPCTSGMFSSQFSQFVSTAPSYTMDSKPLNSDLSNRNERLNMMSVKSSLKPGSCAETYSDLPQGVIEIRPITSDDVKDSVKEDEEKDNLKGSSLSLVNDGHQFHSAEDSTNQTLIDVQKIENEESKNLLPYQEMENFQSYLNKTEVKEEKPDMFHLEKPQE